MTTFPFIAVPRQTIVGLLLLSFKKHGHKKEILFQFTTTSYKMTSLTVYR